MKVLGKTVTLILLTIFFVGFCVLLYPAVSQYWNSKVQSRVVVDYTNEVEEMDPEKHDKLLEQAVHRIRTDRISQEDLSVLHQFIFDLDPLITAGIFPDDAGLNMIRHFTSRSFLKSVRTDALISILSNVCISVSLSSRRRSAFSMITYEVANF